MNRPDKYRVTPDARGRLEGLTRNGVSPAKAIRHARVLLMADAGHPAGRYRDAEVAAAPGTHVNTVARVRKRFALAGEGAAVGRKPRATPPAPPKRDGAAAAQLVAPSAAPGRRPDGRGGRCGRRPTRWSAAGWSSASAGRRSARRSNKTRASRG